MKFLNWLYLLVALSIVSIASGSIALANSERVYPKRLDQYSESELIRICAGDRPPPFSSQDIKDLLLWTTGSVFDRYANMFGVNMDRKAWFEDCPNRGILNFAQSLGGDTFRCLGNDIFSNYYNLSVEFARLSRSQSPQFKERFFKAAKAYKMDRYFSKPNH